MRGKVKFFNIKKGFGFITRDDGQGDVFFNSGALKRNRDYDPVEGDVVEFDSREGKLGPIAHHIEQIRLPE